MILDASLATLNDAVSNPLTVVDVLETAAAAVLHADPELVPAQVGAVVGNDVRVPAVL